MIDVSVVESPLGRLAVAERKGKVLAISFGGRRVLRTEHPEIWQMDDVVEGQVCASALAIQTYLAGTSPRLTVPTDLALVGGAFDRAVLKRLVRVPFGQTVFYGELAAMVDRPGAARAVGSAMRRNPIPILVPCHRVLPRSGGLGNYTGGVSKKKWLLAREGITA